MPRTSLAQHLTNACSIVHESTIRNVSPDQVLHDRHHRRITRREWLRQATLVGAAAVGAAALPPIATANAATAPRIVIVGAGLAGLTVPTAWGRRAIRPHCTKQQIGSVAAVGRGAAPLPTTRSWSTAAN